MKRLPKGYGSVYKLSGSRRRPFTARIQTWHNTESGRPEYKYLGYYKTSQEALQALMEYNKSPYDLDLINYTISDLYSEFKKRKLSKLSNSGVYIYQAAYKYLAPIHDMKIKEIKTFHLQKIIDNIDRKWQTKNHVQTLLNQLFDIAIELDIVTKNYAKFTKIGPKEESNIHKSFTSDEIKLLFEAIKTEPFADTVLIMIYSGLRPSELLNIEKSSVNLEQMYITAGSKTKAGKNRVIPINKKIFPFIKKRCASSNIYIIEKNGCPVKYSSYRRIYIDLMKKLNMEHLPHDGRHTFASLADTAGMNKVSIKRIMGHATNDITENVYTHKEIDELIKNINMI